MRFSKIVLFAVLSFMFIQCSRNEAKKEVFDSMISDSQRFALEYPLVGKNNIFVYRNASETADILANGRGIVFIGFQECPWCQHYAVFLHDIAQEMEIETIFYCDIREDRQSNSESY